MNGIVYDAKRIKAYEGLMALGELMQKDPTGYVRRLTSGEGMDRLQ